jgi:hypothetical protein
MKTKTITYLAIMLVGYFLSRSLPFFEVLGVTPWLLFCALFIPYFGYWKALAICLIPGTVNIAINYQGISDLNRTMINGFTSLIPNIRNVMDPSALLFPVFVMIYVDEAVLLYVTFRALKKVGMFSRITF